jgi:hypothetical protein
MAMAMDGLVLGTSGASFILVVSTGVLLQYTQNSNSNTLTLYLCRDKALGALEGRALFGNSNSVRSMPGTAHRARPTGSRRTVRCLPAPRSCCFAASCERSHRYSIWANFLKPSGAPGPQAQISGVKARGHLHSLNS